MSKENVSLKKRLSRGEIVCGPWCVIPSGPVMNIVATAGFDFVIIDLEHSTISFETAEEMIRAALVEGVTPIVRFGGIYEESILKVLDSGAAGVLTAHVELAADAERMVSMAKYFPVGTRGFSPYTRAGGYSGGNIQNHAGIQNEETLTGVILEGKSGIENIDSILEVDNLDIVYVGAYDLSQALGRPGEVDHPDVKEHLKECISKINDAGKAAGGYVAKNSHDFAWMIDMGMQFVTFLPDCAVFQNAMRSAVDDFRDVLSRRRK